MSIIGLIIVVIIMIGLPHPSRRTDDNEVWRVVHEDGQVSYSNNLDAIDLQQVRECVRMK
jgi:hypothetical protein